MKCTPEVIDKLEENQVFVFGSNSTGFHGAGAAGLACRGTSKNTWRDDLWFLKALNSEKNSLDRIGKWAILGQARGFQVGTIGKSYAIETIQKPGLKRSIPLQEIKNQIILLIDFAKKNPEMEFLVTKIGSSLAGYSVIEIKTVFVEIKEIPKNIVLPKEYEFRYY